MRTIIKILKFILFHPIGKKKKTKAIFRFLCWQASSRLKVARSQFIFVDNTKLNIFPKQTVSTGNYYVGLLEFSEMAFAAHLLNETDVFFDIGTNIGTYSIIASGVSNAKTFSFEPIPKTFSFLINNIKLNNLSEKITALNIGLSDKSGIAHFTSNLDANNHIIRDNIGENKVSVEVKTLNDFENYFPTLIKIDVEGYEDFILKGGDKVLKQDSLKAIIIEVNNEGDKYKVSKNEVHKTLLSYGYETYEYKPFDRILEKQKEFTSDNRIYIKDFEFVSTRILNSNPFNVWGIKI